MDVSTFRASLAALGTGSRLRSILSVMDWLQELSRWPHFRVHDEPARTETPCRDQVHLGHPAQRLSEHERVTAALIGAMVAHALWTADGGLLSTSTVGLGCHRTDGGRMSSAIRLQLGGRARVPPRHGGAAGGRAGMPWSRSLPTAPCGCRPGARCAWPPSSARRCGARGAQSAAPSRACSSTASTRGKLKRLDIATAW